MGADPYNPKIILPRVSGILHRTRLVEYLKQNAEKKLILILGRAAQGKSTLAAAYTTFSKTPCAWMNLGVEDSNPVNLFYLLVQSLQHAFQEIDLSPLLEYPRVGLGPREGISLYRHWLSSIFDRVTSPVHIILDGLDQLGPASYGFLRTLIEETPPHIRLIMISRMTPPLELQKIKLDQDMITIDNDQLSFSLDETKEFFKETHKIPLGDQVIREIHRVTEGWVGGLTLFAVRLRQLSMDEQKQLSPDSYGDNFRTEVFDYFKEQVFSAQLEKAKKLLIYSSILDFVEPGLARDLTGIDNTEEILSVMSRKNLFVQTVYNEKRGTLYRYHRLFRDFLRAKFETATNETERRNWFSRAGGFYQERGELRDAVKYYLEGRSYQSAAGIIKEIGMELLKEGRNADLGGWLENLPEDLLQSNPWLLLYRCMSRRFSAIEENSRVLPKIIDAFEKTGDRRGLLLALAYLLETSNFRGRDSIPVTSLLEKSEALLESTDIDVYRYETGILWLQVGCANTMRGGDPQKGLFACQKAYLIAESLKDTSLQLYALIHIVGALAWLGEFSSGDIYYDKLSMLVDTNPDPELHSLQLASYSGFLVAKGEIERAQEIVSAAKTQAEQSGLVHLLPLALFYDLTVKVNLDKYPEAEQISGALLGFARSRGNLLLVGRILLWLGILHYRMGRYEKANQLLEDSRKIFSSQSTWSETHLNICKLLLALTSVDDAGYDASYRELKGLYKSSIEMSNHLFAVHAGFALALTAWRKGLVTETSEYLQAGFKIAQQRKYEHFLFLSPRDTVEVCLIAIELDVKDATGYATNLITSNLSKSARPSLDKLFEHLTPKLRNRALKIIRSIHISSLPCIRIEAFGGFRVLRAGRPMEKTEWRGNQPRRLLKAILARGGRNVPIDVVIEDLWPEREAKAGQASFTVNLHRLRRILEPESAKCHGSSYIELKGNLVSLNETLCTTDVEDLLELIRRAEQHKTGGEIRDSLDACRKAVEIYKGDFLPEELYADWVSARREHLRQLFLEFLLKMAAFHEERGASREAIGCYQRALQTDPLLEVAYQRLMLIHSNRGNRGAAAKLYEACKGVFESELGLEPADLTKAIYRKIIES